MKTDQQKIKEMGFSDFFISRLNKELDRLIKVSLEEDLDQQGDITSNAIFYESNIKTANIISKQNGIFSGSFIIIMVYEKIDPTITVEIFVTDGDTIEKGQKIAQIHGEVKNILIGERTVLNFISRTSGISTLTNEFVKLASESKLKILDTRKTLPGWRYLDKYAVRAGGGVNHRIGLFDMFLIKENHIAAAGGIKNAVEQCKNYLKENKLASKIEVETTNLNEVQEALDVGVDRIMLDNMTVEKIKQAVKIIKGKAEIEISGGVDLNNINELVTTGVDFISIGKLTHSVKAFDFSMLIV